MHIKQHPKVNQKQEEERKRLFTFAYIFKTNESMNTRLANNITEIKTKPREGKKKKLQMGK